MTEHVRVWRYRVPADRRKEFVHHYATDGTWTRLFQQAGGYLGTTLWQDASDPGTWYTQDRWRSEDDFENFNRAFGRVYAELDRQLDGIASEEILVGAMNRVQA